MALASPTNVAMSPTRSTSNLARDLIVMEGAKREADLRRTVTEQSNALAHFTSTEEDNTKLRSCLRDVEKELVETHSRMEDLVTKYVICLERKEALEHEGIGLQQQNAQLGFDISDALRGVGDEKARSASLAEKYAALDSTSRTMAVELTTAQAAVADLTKSCSELHRKLFEKDEELRKVRDELEWLQDHVPSLEGEAQSAEYLQLEVQELTRTVSNLESQRENSARKEQEFHNSTRQLEENSVLQSELLSQDNVRLKAMIGDLEESLLTTHQRLTDTIKRYDAHVLELQNAYLSFEENKGRLTTERHMFEERGEKWALALQHSLTREASARNRIMQLEGRVDQLGTLQCEMSSEREQRAQGLAREHASQLRIEQLEGKVAALTTLASEYESYKRSETNTVQEAQQTIVELTRQLAASEERCECEARKHKHTKGILLTMEQEVEGTYKSLTELLAASEQKCSDLEQRLQEVLYQHARSQENLS
jgi:chromosome segregation ATPase